MRRPVAPVNSRRASPTVRPPRVLLVSGEYPPALGGVGDYSARLVAALGAQGIAVAVLASGRDEPVPLRAGGVSRGVSDWGLAAFPRVLAAARAWRADLVHLQYPAG